eukprot:Hpha_TRINITY_DN7542_c0_g1::TRINITY_DN7542_c0_g1_i1::g.18770::m.18770/K20196/KIF3B; kinesin family member 3B
MVRGGDKRQHSENIRVVIRARPLSRAELARGERDVVTLNIPTGTVSTPREHRDDPKAWSFNAVYNNSFTQRDIFREEAIPLIDYVFQGYNTTIFAYGQSGSGKTYTMSGHAEHREDPGILPNSLSYFFEKLRELSKLEPQKQFTLRLSFVEVYQDRVSDLLSPDQKHLPIRLSGNTFDVPQATQRVLTSTEEALAAFDYGNAKRHVASHALNDRSSRSHTLFTLKLECVDIEIPEAPKRVVSKFNLVDLAGSERQSKTGSTGETLAEGAKINSSLLALGCCIDAILKGDFIPYRSTSLTMLLKDSLGGNAKTLMFATVSPSSGNLSETNSTLGFAARAKKIKNEPHKNLDPKDALIAQLKDRIAALEGQLGLGPEQSTAFEDLNAEMSQIQLQLQESRAEVQSQREKFDAIISARDEAVALLTRQMKEQSETHHHEFRKHIRAEQQKLEALRGIVEAHLRVSLVEDQLPSSPDLCDPQTLQPLLRLISDQCALARRASRLQEALNKREAEHRETEAALQKSETAAERAEAEGRQLRCDLAQLEGRAGEAASELKGETERGERQDKRIQELTQQLQDALGLVEQREQETLALRSDLARTKQEYEQALHERRRGQRQQEDLMAALAAGKTGVLRQRSEADITATPPQGRAPARGTGAAKRKSSRSLSESVGSPPTPSEPPRSAPLAPGAEAPAEADVPMAGTDVAAVLDELQHQLQQARSDAEAAHRDTSEAVAAKEKAEALTQATEGRMQRTFDQQLAEYEERVLYLTAKRQQDKENKGRLKHWIQQLQQELEDSLRRSWSEKEAMKVEMETLRREAEETEQRIVQQSSSADGFRRLQAERQLLEKEVARKQEMVEEFRLRLQQAQEETQGWHQRCDEAKAAIKAQELKVTEREQEVKDERMKEMAQIIARHSGVLEEKEAVHKKKSSRLRKEIAHLKQKVEEVRLNCQIQLDEAMQERDAERVRAQSYQQLAEEEKAKALRASMSREDRERDAWDRRQQSMRDEMRRQAEQRSMGVRALLNESLSSDPGRPPQAPSVTGRDDEASPQGPSLRDLLQPPGSAGRRELASVGKREATPDGVRPAAPQAPQLVSQSSDRRPARLGSGVLTRRATTMPPR